jgi:hypothetical protein
MIKKITGARFFNIFLFTYKYLFTFAGYIEKNNERH